MCAVGKHLLASRGNPNSAFWDYSVMCTKMSVKTKWFASSSAFDARQNTNVDEPLSFRPFPALIKNIHFSEILSQLVEIAFKNISHKTKQFVVAIVTWQMQQICHSQSFSRAESTLREQN